MIQKKREDSSTTYQLGVPPKKSGKVKPVIFKFV